jgi:hypothetical protein
LRKFKRLSGQISVFIAPTICGFRQQHQLGDAIPDLHALRRELLVRDHALQVQVQELARAQVLRDPPTPFGPLVYDDQYTNAAALTGISDGLKNIPFGSNPGWYVNFGGSLRERFENFTNSEFGFRSAGGVPNEDYILHRLLLSGDFHFGPDFRTFIQFGDELEAGRRPGPQPTDIDHGDLAQGFAELDLPVTKDSTMGVRAGRQEMMFGSNRLVDIREGPNIRQSYDGVRAWATLGDARIDAFWTRPVFNKQGWFDDEPDPTQQFFGVYATSPIKAVPRLSVDAYYMGLDRTNATLDAGTENEQRHSVGTRLFGNAGPIDYNFEGIYQFGHFGDRPISAFALFSDTGYTIESAWSRPRFAMKADIVSGGDSRGTGSLGTFYPLFPKNNYFNESNIQTPMNYMDVYPYVQIQPRKDLAFMAGVDVLWRENIPDSFYQPPGIPVIPGNANGKRFLGEAFNLQVEWQATPNLNVNAAVVEFCTDGFLRSAGGRNTTWTGVWATFNF